MTVAEIIASYFWFGLILGLFLGHILSGWLFHNRRKDHAISDIPSDDNHGRFVRPRADRHETPVSAASATEIGTDQ